MEFNSAFKGLKKYSRQSKVARQSHTYTGEKQYICEICNMRFSYRTYPARHEYSHTGRKSWTRHGTLDSSVSHVRINSV